MITINIKSINNYLQRNLPQPLDKPKLLSQAIRYSTLNGGKRIRPLLCIGAYRTLGGNSNSIFSIACSLELIHNFSLIHDDLPCMDNDDFRRGKPTCHKVFGENVAVLAGDQLLNLAFEWVTEAKTIKKEIKLELIRELVKVVGAGGLIGGQILDLIKLPTKITTQYVLDIYNRKTTALIATSVRLGAIAARATKKELNQLTKYGESIGLAFQLIDDILDLRQDSCDKLQINYALLFGEQKTRKLILQLQQQAQKSLTSFGSRSKLLKAIASLIFNQI